MKRDDLENEIAIACFIAIIVVVVGLVLHHFSVSLSSFVGP